jgi:hypothetical protein
MMFFALINACGLSFNLWSSDLFCNIHIGFIAILAPTAWSTSFGYWSSWSLMNNSTTSEVVILGEKIPITHAIATTREILTYSLNLVFVISEIFLSRTVLKLSQFTYPLMFWFNYLMMVMVTHYIYDSQYPSLIYELMFGKSDFLIINFLIGFSISVLVLFSFFGFSYLLISGRERTVRRNENIKRAKTGIETI